MKKWWQSKMVWFNTIMTIILVAQLVEGLYAEYAQITALVTGIGNIVLRVWYTSTEVEKSIR